MLRVSESAHVELRQMITIVNRYLIKRLLLASIIAVLAIYLPVLLIQLLAQLPGAALSSELLWPALFGLAPTIFYITLPVTVAIAITWTYRELSADGTLTTLYNAGLSLLNVRMPAFFLATTAVVLGFITSNILAPQGSTHVEDVLHLIKNDLSPSLLTPQQFHILNDGKRVIQYQERINRNWISGIFIKETNEDEELIFFARDAIFERRENETWIILRDGHMQSRKIGQSDYDTVSFTQITRPTGLAGMKLPKREWTGYFELETSKFLAEYANAQKAPRKESEWISEALERFGIPILALGHTLLGLAYCHALAGHGSKQSDIGGIRVWIDPSHPLSDCAHLRIR